MVNFAKNKKELQMKKTQIKNKMKRNKNNHNNMNQNKVIRLLLIALLGIMTQNVVAKKTVIDFSDATLSPSIEDVSGNDYDKYVFEVEDIKITFKEAQWKVSETYHYLRIKDSSTHNSEISIGGETSTITRVLFCFNPVYPAGNGKLKLNDGSGDENISPYQSTEKLTASTLWCSAWEGNTRKLNFCAPEGNVSLSKIIIYYDKDTTTAEEVETVRNFNTNSPGGVYTIANELTVNRVYSETILLTDADGNEKEEVVHIIYASDAEGGICIELAASLMQEGQALPKIGNILKGLTGVLNVTYNKDNSFLSSPKMQAEEENGVSYEISETLSSVNNVITDITLTSIQDDTNVNREFLLTTLTIGQQEDGTWYYTSGGEEPITIKIEDRWGVLSSVIQRGTGNVNFILDKRVLETSTENQEPASSYVAYPVNSEIYTSIDRNSIERRDEIRYYNLEGQEVREPISGGIYILKTSIGTEKIIFR